MDIFKGEKVTCELVRRGKVFTRYIYNCLTPNEREKIDSHLARCGRCRYSYALEKADLYACA